MSRFPRLARLAGPILSLALLMPAPQADACTSFRLKAADGSVVYARTMEYGQDLASKVAIFHEGTKVVGGHPGWRVQQRLAPQSARFALPERQLP